MDENEMYVIAQQVEYMFLGTDAVYKISDGSMCEIGQFSANFEYEYSWICVVSVARA